MSDKVMILLPGYNVGRHLDELVPKIRENLPEAHLCLVDDGSADDTGERARANDLDVLVHPQNRGKGEALKTGFAHAVSRDDAAVITMDSDGQHRPEELELFVRSWRAGHDVVVGNRMEANENMPWLRKRTNEFTSWVVSRLAQARIPDSQNGYRLFDTRVLRAIELESSKYDLESEILIKAGALGFQIGAVPVATVYHDQHSSIHPFVDTLRFIRLVHRARRWRRQPGARPDDAREIPRHD